MQSTVDPTYILPHLDELLNCDHLRKDYKGNTKERLALITLIEIICERIRKIREADPNISEDVLKEIAGGAWFYCMESIAITYRVLEPQLKEGIFFNSGSTLYKLILQKLGIVPDNPINEKEKLYYLNQFHKFFFRDGININQLIAFKANLKSSNFDMDALQKNLIHLMIHVFTSIEPLAKQLLKAIPREKVFDDKLQKLFKEYMARTKNNNLERKFLAQLAYAIGQLEDDPEPEDNFISRSRRIKLGFIFYIMQSIADSYLLHCLHPPKGHSNLYNLCCEMLNDNDLSDISAGIKHLCLSTFLSYIRTDKNRRCIEKTLNEHCKEENEEIIAPQIDSKAFQIEDKLNVMIRNLDPTNHPILTRSTLTAAALGAIFAAAPGYGVGYSIGFMAGLTDQFSGVKTRLMKPVSGVLCVVLGESAKNLGYFTASVVVNATTERVLAKILETLSMIVGALGFGGIKIILYDFSFKTLVDIATLCFLLYDNLPEKKLISASDLTFIQFLKDLPPEIFSQEKKDHLERLLLSPNELTLFSSGFLEKPMTFQKERAYVEDEDIVEDEDFVQIPRCN